MLTANTEFAKNLNDGCRVRWARWIAMLWVMLVPVWVSGTRGHGQEPSPAAANNTEGEISTRNADSAIKVRVNLVLVRVVVRDANGKVVPELKKEDFQLLDNGKEQKISTFTVESPETRSKTAATVSPGVAETGTEAAVEGEPSKTNAVVMPQRFVALVFDDLHMKTAEAMAVHAATEKLFKTLTPTDRVAIYSTSGDVTQEFTADAQTLRKTLAAIVPRPGKGEGEFHCPDITYYMADLIDNKQNQETLKVALADSQDNCLLTANDIVANAHRIVQEGDQNTRTGYQYLENVVRHLASLPGQRLLVYVSPGFIIGEAVLANSWELIDRAMRAGIVVNTIDARSLYSADLMPDIDASPQQPITLYGNTGPARDRLTTASNWQAMEGTYRMEAQIEQSQVLAGLAASTGGRYFHNRNDLDAAMSEALVTPDLTYMLAFSPLDLKPDGKFHKLTVKVANSEKYQIQVRSGYYAPKISADPEEMAKREVREALFAQDEILDVPIELRTQFFKVDATMAQLTVITHLDIKGIRFRKAEGRSYSDVVLAVGVFDDNRQFVDGQMREISLKLTDSTLGNLGRTGLTTKITFTVKPGTYLVRSVVRASEGTQLTARNTTTVIPN
jgi:VWFA-related protein